MTIIDNLESFRIKLINPQSAMKIYQSIMSASTDRFGIANINERYEQDLISQISLAIYFENDASLRRKLSTIFSYHFILVWIDFTKGIYRLIDYLFFGSHIIRLWILHRNNVFSFGIHFSNI